MIIALGIMTAAGGLFLFLWYRTVVGLPQKLRPRFTRPYIFKWGIPGVSAALVSAGLILLASVHFGVAAVTALVAAGLAYAVIAFDSYSAEMRIIRDRYRAIRKTNPGLAEDEALYQTAIWRYPGWSQDRLVELVAGKDIESLTLLIILNEQGINPISDWELYRSLKSKAARIVGPGK